MSPSNPHILIQNLLTATYLASATNSSHISWMCRISVSPQWCLEPWKGQNAALAKPQVINSLWLLTILTLYTTHLELIPHMMMFCLQLNSSLDLRIYFVWVSSAGLTKLPYKIIVKWPCGIWLSFLMIILVYFCCSQRGCLFWREQPNNLLFFRKGIWAFYSISHILWPKFVSMSRTLAMQWWDHLHSLLVYDLITHFLPKIHWGSINVCWRSYSSCWSRHWHTSPHTGCRKVVLGHFQLLHMKKCFSLWGPTYWSSIFTTNRPFPYQCSLRPLRNPYIPIDFVSTFELQDKTQLLPSSPLPSSYGILAIHVLFLMLKSFESDPGLMLRSLLSLLKHWNHVLCTCKPHGKVN